LYSFFIEQEEPFDIYVLISTRLDDLATYNNTATKVGKFVAVGAV